MTKELQALKRLRKCLKYGDDELGDVHYSKHKEDLDIIESVINNNYFYKYLLSRICEHMGLDITKHRDLIETENEIFNYICENECFRVDVATNKNKLKALEIIKEKEVNVYWLTHYLTLDAYNEQVCIFRMLNKEEWNLLKETLE